MDHVDRIQQQWKRERPELNLEPQNLVARIHRLALHLTADITAVYAEYGLSEGEFDILCTLRREGAPFEMRPADISQGTMVTTGGTSKRLDRLEKSGLIERRDNHRGDRRSKLVRLTDKGRHLIDQAFAAHIENERKLVERLAPSERETLERLLKTWLASYEH